MTSLGHNELAKLWSQVNQCHFHLTFLGCNYYGNIRITYLIASYQRMTETQQRFANNIYISFSVGINSKERNFTHSIFYCIAKPAISKQRIYFLSAIRTRHHIYIYVYILCVEIIFILLWSKMENRYMYNANKRYIAEYHFAIHSNLYFISMIIIVGINWRHGMYPDAVLEKDLSIKR